MVESSRNCPKKKRTNNTNNNNNNYKLASYRVSLCNPKLILYLHSLFFIANDRHTILIYYLVLCAHLKENIFCFFVVVVLGVYLQVNFVWQLVAKKIRRIKVQKGIQKYIENERKEAVRKLSALILAEAHVYLMVYIYFSIYKVRSSFASLNDRNPRKK